MRFFEPNVFSASDVPHGKPAPDLFLHAAASVGIDPPIASWSRIRRPAVAAAVAAGMTAIGFVGGRHAGADLGEHLTAAGAETIIADMRQLESTSSFRCAAGRRGISAADLRPAAVSAAALSSAVGGAERIEADIDDIGLELGLRGIGKLKSSSICVNDTLVLAVGDHDRHAREFGAIVFGCTPSSHDRVAQRHVDLTPVPPPGPRMTRPCTPTLMRQRVIPSTSTERAVCDEG